MTETTWIRPGFVRMILPACDNCGEVDSRRMIGLMTVFFGPLLELPQQPGYFYVCPRCYDELILPHLEEIRALLRKHHPVEGGAGDIESVEGS